MVNKAKNCKASSEISKMVEEILEASKYRSGNDSCNSLYMGGMMSARLFSILQADYGITSLSDALNKASVQNIIKAREYCDGFIQKMRKHPVHKCPTCGQIVQGRG